MPQLRATLEAPTSETEPQPLTQQIRGQTIFVVTVNFHQAGVTERAVASALGSVGVAVHVIVVDNESDGQWELMPLASDERVTTITNKANLGFGTACNLGIERAVAHGDCAGVLLLNNDATLEPRALGMLKVAAAEYGMAAPKIILPAGRIYSAGGIVEIWRGRCRNRGIYAVDIGQFDHAETLRFASACALFIDFAALHSGVRFFDPYFLYYEDADLCLRLGAAGFKVQYVPHAMVQHLESASSAGPNQAAMLAYYTTRNRLLFLKRNAAPGLRHIGYATVHVAAFAKYLMNLAGGHRSIAAALVSAIRDFWLGRLGPRT